MSVTEHKTKRFRLAFVNAAEDVPRLIRAYGKACFGEFALVLRPTDRRGVMVRITTDGAFMWGSEWPLIAEIKRAILAGGLAKPFLRINVESAFTRP